MSSNFDKLPRVDDNYPIEHLVATIELLEDDIQGHQENIHKANLRKEKWSLYPKFQKAIDKIIEKEKKTIADSNKQLEVFREELKEEKAKLERRK